MDMLSIRSSLDPPPSLSVALNLHHATTTQQTPDPRAAALLGRRMRPAAAAPAALAAIDHQHRRDGSGGGRGPAVSAKGYGAGDLGHPSGCRCRQNYCGVVCRCARIKFHTCMRLIPNNSPFSLLK